MSDEIKNAGTKGFVLMFIIVAFLSFLSLIFYLYFYNFNFLPGQ